MDCVEFFQKMKELDTLLQSFFETSEFDQEIFASISSIIKNDEIQKNFSKFKIVLNLISSVTSYHRIVPDFYIKFDRIYKLFESNLKTVFTDPKIFKIFSKNKRALLYLFKKRTLKMNSDFIRVIKKNKFEGYFSHEMKVYDKKLYGNVLSPDEFLKYDKCRRVGENENYIASLIRDDKVEEFITYVNETNFPLQSTISPSIFETHRFLADKSASLIEYAAFFGSIDIFQFLRMSDNIELNSDLWPFAIHSNNADIIHLLEDNHIKPPNNDYESLIKESIMCHNNNVANYLINSYSEKNIEEYYMECFKYYNFELFLEDSSVDNFGYMFLFAFEYNYFDIAKQIITVPGFNPQEKLISKLNIFFKLCFFFFFVLPREFQLTVFFGISRSNNLRKFYIMFFFMVFYLFFCF